LLPDGRDIEPWTPAALKQDACAVWIVDNYRGSRRADSVPAPLSFSAWC
jgi:hypothetical protein